MARLTNYAVAFTAAMLLAGCAAVSDTLFPPMAGESSRPTTTTRVVIPPGPNEVGAMPALGTSSFEPAGVTPGQATGKFDVLMRSFDIMGKGLREAQLPEADVVITPRLDGITSTDFEGKNRAILAGEQAVVEAMPRIREKLAARGAR